MKYWIDTEFYEDGKTIDLISIGIVAEDGRELYLENKEFRKRRASQWVKDNVLTHLHAHGPEFCFSQCPWKSKKEIAARILEFCDPLTYGKPEFWAYYADYDWVVFCQLFGTMMDLPKGFPMYCRDIKQLCDDLGNPELPKQGNGEHHALADARWNRMAHEWLLEHKRLNSPVSRLAAKRAEWAAQAAQFARDCLCPDCNARGVYAPLEIAGQDLICLTCDYSRPDQA